MSEFLDSFKEKLDEAILEAETTNGSGPDVHSRLLELLFSNIRDSWQDPREALEEIKFVLRKVFPEMKH